MVHQLNFFEAQIPIHQRQHGFQHEPKKEGQSQEPPTKPSVSKTKFVAQMRFESSCLMISMLKMRRFSHITIASDKLMKIVKI